MSNNNDSISMELVFSRIESNSQKEKLRAFWKFIDSLEDLKPFEILTETKIPKDKCSCSTLDTEDITRQMWYDQLKVFQEFGLDRVALAANESSKSGNLRKKSQEQRTNRYIVEICSDFADTVKQSYEELRAEIKEFEDRVNKKTKNVE